MVLLELVRRQVYAVDRNQPVSQVRTMEWVRGHFITPQGLIRRLGQRLCRPGVGHDGACDPWHHFRHGGQAYA